MSEPAGKGGDRTDGQRVLVTGGCGYIGSALVPRLLDDERVSEVVVLDSLAAGSPAHLAGCVGPDLDFRPGDVRDYGAVERPTRGVDRVEVSLDDGDSWIAADLSDPLPGDDVWRQWRHAFDPDGFDDVVVRAVDGEGTVQTAEATDSFPSGATGWVRQSVDR